MLLFGTTAYLLSQMETYGCWWLVNQATLISAGRYLGVAVINNGINDIHFQLPGQKIIIIVTATKIKESIITHPATSFIFPP
jgi:hypothetical protein